MKQQIQNLITNSRKEGNTTALFTYQSILSSIQAEENSKNKELTKEQIINIFVNDKKAYQEILPSVDKQTVYKKEELIQRISLLDKFIPEEQKVDLLPISEYPTIISKALSETKSTNPKEMGNVMKYLKNNYKGQLDFKVITPQVKEELQKLVY